MRLLQGKLLVKTARTFLKSKLIDPSSEFKFGEWPKWCDEKRGVFVTLMTHPARALRGCVGFPEPVFPLKDALLEAAFSAAFRDSRFPSLEETEMKKLVVEVSVLTKPKRILARKPSELLSSIHLGKDGLIVRYHSFSGLLLPQVPLEWAWSVPEFVSQTCNKAGLPSDIWMTDFDRVVFYKFQSEIFCEKAPDGDVLSL
jgi:uncharacterized protein